MPIVGTREFAIGACLEIEFLKLMRPTQQQQLERRRSDYLAVQCYCFWRFDQCSRLYLVLKITKYGNKHVICCSLGLQCRGNISNVLCGFRLNDCIAPDENQDTVCKNQCVGFRESYNALKPIELLRALAGLVFKNSAFRQHSAYVCSVLII